MICSTVRWWSDTVEVVRPHPADVFTVKQVEARWVHLTKRMERWRSSARSFHCSFVRRTAEKLIWLAQITFKRIRQVGSVSRKQVRKSDRCSRLCGSRSTWGRQFPEHRDCGSESTWRQIHSGFAWVQAGPPKGGRRSTFGGVCLVQMSRDSLPSIDERSEPKLLPLSPDAAWH